MGPSFTALLVITGTFVSGAAANPVEVIVHDYAGVKTAELAHAESEASRVMATGGVDVRWTNCTESGSAPELCGPTLEAGAVIVQILPGGTSTRNMHRDALGFAASADSGLFGGYACVFYDRVEALPGRQLRIDVLLGHVIAHELGHLLLRIHGHSRTGIMAGAWDPKSLLLAARGELVFDGRQRRRMSYNVARGLQLARAGSNGSGKQPDWIGPPEDRR